MKGLEFQIEEKREQLIDCFDQYQQSLANEQVLSASMELDKLIVEYLTELVKKGSASYSKIKMQQKVK